MIQAVKPKTRAAELRRFIDQYEGNEQVLEMVLSVARSFAVDDVVDDGCEYCRFDSDGNRILRAVWSDDLECRMLIEYRTEGESVRTVKFRRDARGEWFIGDHRMPGGVRWSHFEVLYMDLLESVELALKQENGSEK